MIEYQIKNLTVRVYSDIRTDSVTKLTKEFWIVSVFQPSTFKANEYLCKAGESPDYHTVLVLIDQACEMARKIASKKARLKNTFYGTNAEGYDLNPREEFLEYLDIIKPELEQEF